LLGLNKAGKGKSKRSWEKVLRQCKTFSREKSYGNLAESVKRVLRVPERSRTDGIAEGAVTLEKGA